MEAAILEACEGIPLDEVESLTLDSKVQCGQITGLDSAVCLEELSMVSCGVTTLDGFPLLAQLTSLELSDNGIKGGLKALAGLVRLTELNLGGNKIASLDELNDIKHLPLLQIDLEGNPCADESEEYRRTVFGMFPTLMLLDRKDKEGDEVEEGSDEEEDEEIVSDDDDDDDDASDASDDDDDAADDDEPIEISDDDDEDDEDEEEASDDDDEPGLAALVGAPLDDDDADEGFEATSDPESEDFEDPEDDAEDEEAQAAKKPRTE
jgi:hypothetical protein